jgi:hypothetical protein
MQQVKPGCFVVIDLGSEHDLETGELTKALTEMGFVEAVKDGRALVMWRDMRLEWHLVDELTIAWCP